MLSGKSTYDSQEAKLLKRHKENVLSVKDVFMNYSPSPCTCKCVFLL